MNRRDFLTTGALVVAPAVPGAILAGPAATVAHTTRENLELELAGLEDLIPRLYSRRVYLQDKLCMMDCAPWIEYVDYAAKTTPTRRETIVGGVTPQTVLDGFLTCEDVDFLIVDFRTRLEICKWAHRQDIRDSPKKPFLLYGVPCFVNKGLMRDTARFVRMTDAKLLHIVEVEFV